MGNFNEYYIIILIINIFVIIYLKLCQGQAIDSEHLSELTEEEMEVNFIQSRISGFAKLDIRYFIPFFTRRFTQEVSGKNFKLLKYKL